MIFIEADLAEDEIGTVSFSILLLFPLEILTMSIELKVLNDVSFLFLKCDYWLQNGKLWPAVGEYVVV